MSSSQIISQHKSGKRVEFKLLILTTVPDSHLKLYARTGMKADTAKQELVIAVNSPPTGRPTQGPNCPKFNLWKLPSFILIHLGNIFVDWMNA